jgi:hypothetical protein
LFIYNYDKFNYIKDKVKGLKKEYGLIYLKNPKYLNSFGAKVEVDVVT